MAWPVLPHGFLGAQGSETDSYRIERSLRFNSADSAYLNRTPASAGNLKTWTWSGWVKRSSLSGVSQVFFGTGDASNNNSNQIRFNASNQLEVFNYVDGVSGFSMNLITTQVFRDVSSWGHLVVVVDTTQATSSNRVKIYWNGSEVTSFGTSTYPSQNNDGYINSTVSHGIGRGGTFNSTYLDGYLTEINFIDGQALTPSSFGETDAITGRWKAKAYSGTYGTNGFYLKFADNSGTTSTTLGKDSSGNGNNWTPNNFSVTAGAGNDSLVDSPTNYGTDTGVGGEVRGNYATLNPLTTSGGTLSNGNLEYDGPSAWRPSPSTILIPSTGKWYFEGTLKAAPASSTFSGAFAGIGVIQPSAVSAWSYNSGTSLYLTDTGHISNYNAGSTTSFTGNASGTVISLAIDRDANTVTFYQNGVSRSVQTIGVSSGSDLYAFIASYSSANGQFAANFGQRPFAYTAPTGFKALCTTNLPTPTIQKPSSYMDVVTFTATGSNQSITGLNFSPDFVWIKNRANWVGNRHTLFDTTRGAIQRLDSSTTEAEAADNDLISFDANGFSGNYSGTTYVAWAWDEAPIAGMDIVSYTGTGAIRTVSHNLGVAPKMIIAKLTNSAGFNWPVYHSSLTSASSFIWLNSTNAQATDATYWGTAPTSSVFSVGTNANVNNNTSPYIAYLFAEVEGFSKFGSYTGNGSADGPFVWCGFRPRWVMYKRTDSTENWCIIDTARDISNVAGSQLTPNSSSAEGTGSSNMDAISNGFKIRSATAGGNVNGGTYIFAAFAESPFKYARAR